MSYSEFVRSRFKSGEKIAEEMTPHKARALYVHIMQAARVANNLDAAKKYAIYNKDIDGISDFPFNIEPFKNFALNPSQAELLHAAIGIAGEAGELLNAVRKHVFDGQPLDEDNVIEELGDLCFYLEAASQAIKMKRGDIEELNMAKLFERYKDGYSDQQAVTRADKAGEE
jgi:NTP pyrophosphatase (non-canonical NTP hydrolase)